MPESLSAFWRMVSLTAANTSRMLEVSVAWVRLTVLAIGRWGAKEGCLLRIQVQVGTVDLIESPQQVLGSAIYIVATGVIWKVVAEGRSRQLGLEQIDLV